MKKTLTQKDIKDLRYQCRMGYVIPVFIFLLGSIFAVAIYELDINSGNEINTKLDLLFAAGCAVIAMLVSYKMNRNYYIDIRNNEKIAYAKILQKKISKTDYEAGSGNMTTLPHNNPMKAFIRYDFIIDNTMFKVDKDLFESCRDGDEVILYYAPKSRYLISIEKE